MHLPIMSRRSSKNDMAEQPSAKRARLATRANSALRDDTEAGGSVKEERNFSQAADFHTLKEAEYGIIEQVSVKNFMCHERLEFNFGPNVNIITGRNGSGRSAVLTAIVVGLGGKADRTNRGSSIKNFIKSGEQFAEITIKLRNRGQDAYKHDRYGDTIVIERRLKMDGTSSYKIKSKDGQTISQKYSELRQIKDQFNIQIDNPMSIVDEDSSHYFIYSPEPKDNYTFFLKATKLEQMSNDYASIQQHRDFMKSILQRKKEDLDAMKKEMKREENRTPKFTASQNNLSSLKRLETLQLYDEIKESFIKIKKELTMFS